MSVLDTARSELLIRAHDADAAGDHHEYGVLLHLQGVADMVCRIAQATGDNVHYRAEKAGPLVDGALEVQRRTLTGYSDVDDDDTHLALAAANDVALQVAAAVRTVMWGLAAPHLTLDRARARQAVEAATAFSAWAAKVSECAVPVDA